MGPTAASWRAHLASTQMDRSAAKVGYDIIHVNTEADALLALSRRVGQPFGPSPSANPVGVEEENQPG